MLCFISSEQMFICKQNTKTKRERERERREILGSERKEEKERYQTQEPRER